MSASVKGLWTKAELAEAHRLAEACKADAAHWVLADWLLLKEPFGSHGVHTGMKARLSVLADELGLSFSLLRNMRMTAHAWPVEHRVPSASFSSHHRWREGGSAMACERAKSLAAIRRTPLGRTLDGHQAVNDHRVNRRTVNITTEVYFAVVTEAHVLGTTISAVVSDLIQEALGARAWLAEEVAA